MISNLFQEDNLKQLEDVEDHQVHLFHPYFAKFEPSLPRKLINELTNEGDRVLDPFCGCGTTLVEASLLGRHAVGIDANPLGCFIAQVKTTPQSDTCLSQIGEILDSINNDIEVYYGQRSLFNPLSSISVSYNLPRFHNRDYWFTKESLHELAIMKAHILQIDDINLRNLALLALSRIIVFASNQQTESRYKRVIKNRSPFDVFKQFSKAFIFMRDAISDYSRKRTDVDVMIHNRDSRYIEYVEPNSIDLLVTSPPYLNSWDYGLYHRFRFFWLDLDVKDYEQKEIGKHLRTLEGRSKTDEVARYSKDMTSCIREFSRLLKKDSYCCIVNANSIVRKKYINTNQLLIDAARENGLNIIEIMDRKVYGPHYGMHASLNSKKIVVEAESFIEENGETNKQEQILVFRKG